MPLCVNCFKPLECSCTHEQPIGESMIGCPVSEKLGAIWVHVTDDAGKNLENVPVVDFDATNVKGVTIRDGLSEGSYDVELALPPQSLLLERHDAPAIAKKTVNVRNGTIAYVSFVLRRKAKLKIEFVFQSKPDERFSAKTLKVKISHSGNGKQPIEFVKETDTGEVDLGWVNTGKYVIAPDYSGLADASSYELDNSTQSFDLQPATERTVPFVVDRRAALKVEIILKPDPAYKSAKKYLEDTISVKAELDGSGSFENRDAAKGVADFHRLKPGKHKITPDYSKLDESKYDWTEETREVELKPGSNETLEFQVEPLYQKVEFIAHCLLTIPDQIFVESTEDANKLVITTGSGGKRTFAFKTEVKPDGFYSSGDVTPNLEGKAQIGGMPGKKTLTLKTNPNDSTGGFWTIGDLRPDALSMMDLTPTAKSNVFNVTFRPKTTSKTYEQKDLTGIWKAKYHGYVNDKKDIDARIDFLADTLNKVYGKANPDPTILKVFMIPECYFQGLYGAYLTDDAAYLLQKLQDLVRDTKWKDWVFAFGTVNSVFEGAPPSGVTYTRKIYEMQNHAPVIRGGVGTAGESSTRMIQKLINSAELADIDAFIPDSEAKKIRPQAVNQEVQFMATENDDDAAKVLAALLREEKANGAPGTLFVSKGLPEKLWKDATASTGFRGLLQEIEEILGTWGMARVIRSIRSSGNDQVSKDLKNWCFCAQSEAREPETELFTLQQATLRVIQSQWMTDQNTDLNKTRWGDTANRKKVLVNVLNAIEIRTAECGFRMTYQKDAIKAKIEDLIANDTSADGFMLEVLPGPKIRPNTLPLWKELLQVYANEKHMKAPAHFTKKSKETLELDDYCFAGPRKAGAWFTNIAEAKRAKACKRIVFGLEICADHADQRLGSINKGGIDIDIQLVPSAGMRPAYFAARPGGFIFNCDGWNKKPESGGKSLEVHFDGPSPFVGKNQEGYSIDISPVFPHSVVGKNGGANLTPKADDIPTPDEGLSKVIFGSGPGEFHIYEAQDLPK